MKRPKNQDKTQQCGCFSLAAGCLVASLIFPFSITFSGWLAFAIGPMSCAFPNRCSRVQEYTKGILSAVILFGGGFGVPLAAGGLVSKAVQMNTINHSKSREGDDGQNNH